VTLQGPSSSDSGTMSKSQRQAHIQMKMIWSLLLTRVNLSKRTCPKSQNIQVDRFILWNLGTLSSPVIRTSPRGLGTLRSLLIQTSQRKLLCPKDLAHVWIPRPMDPMGMKLSRPLQVPPKRVISLRQVSQSPHRLSHPTATIIPMVWCL